MKKLIQNFRKLYYKHKLKQAGINMNGRKVIDILDTTPIEKVYITKKPLTDCLFTDVANDSYENIKVKHLRFYVTALTLIENGYCPILLKQEVIKVFYHREPLDFISSMNYHIDTHYLKQEGRSIDLNSLNYAVDTINKISTQTKQIQQNIKQRLKELR